MCNLERATCIPKRASANMWLQHQETLSFHPFILLQALRAPCRGQHRCGSGASEATARWSRGRCGQQDAQNQAQPVSFFLEFKDFNGWGWNLSCMMAQLSFLVKLTACTSWSALFQQIPKEKLQSLQSNYLFTFHFPNVSQSLSCLFVWKIHHGRI